MTPIPIDQDLNEVDAWEGGEILPPGTHVCHIDDAIEGTSSGGHPQIEVKLRAASGEHEGGTITDWIVVIPSTLGKVKSLLEAAAVKIPEGNFDLDSQILVGQLVQILVREEPYQGEMRSKVKGYSKPSDAPQASAQQPLATAGASVKDDDIPF
jgi:hypothetical protein